MCVVFLALDRHPRWRVVLASNRDEAYARQTAPASVWADCPRVVAGRDLEAGGTWLGARADGAWTVLTNVRDLPAHHSRAASRGDLPRGFLCGGGDPAEFAAEAFRQRAAFNPFNLLVARGAEVWYASTHRAEPEAVPPGVHGLSNATLNVPWPKVARGRAALAEALSAPDLTPQELFPILDDAEPAPEDRLPDTGVGLEKERMLSPVFIASPDYGTRAQTVMLLDAGGNGVFVERTTTPGLPKTVRRFKLSADGIAAVP